MRTLDPGTLDLAPPQPILTGPRRILSEVLWRAAMAVLAVMPLGMAIAHRSSPFFLVLSALCVLGAVAAEGRLKELARDIGNALRPPLGLVALAFLGWSLVSVGWSEFRGLSLRALGEFWLPLAAALVLGLRLPQRMTRLAFWILAGSAVAACLLIIAELSTGLTMRQSLGMRFNSYIFNRPALTLLVLAPPLAVWLAGRERIGGALALAFSAFLLGTAAYSDSGAASLGFIVTLIVFLFARLAPRTSLCLAAGAIVVVMAGAPFFGSVSDRLISSSLHERLANAHSRERVDIWLSFGSAIQARPFLGAGFGVSPRMRDASVAEKVPEARRTLLAVGHPHNTPVQIWAELGIVGAALALVILLLTLRIVSRQPHIVRAASLSLMAGAVAVALVGHGAWQGWWAASLGAAIVWMLAARTTRLETKP